MELLEKATEIVSAFHNKPIDQNLVLKLAEHFPGENIDEKLQNLISIYEKCVK